MPRRFFIFLGGTVHPAPGTCKLLSSMQPGSTPRVCVLIAAAVVLLSLSSVLDGCKLARTGNSVSVPKSCPDGAELKGAPPPDGTEIWCEKEVGGIPVKDGPYVVYNLNGKMMIEGSYRDGKQSGQWTMYHPNGQRASMDYYTDGVRNGLHTSWYANGQKAIEGEYHNDKREGVWHRWDPNGFREWTEVYKDDEKIAGGDSSAPAAKHP
jgi:MORN repeat variant